MLSHSSLKKLFHTGLLLLIVCQSRISANASLQEQFLSQAVVAPTWFSAPGISTRLRIIHWSGALARHSLDHPVVGQLLCIGFMGAVMSGVSPLSAGVTWGMAVLKPKHARNFWPTMTEGQAIQFWKDHLVASPERQSSWIQAGWGSFVTRAKVLFKSWHEFLKVMGQEPSRPKRLPRSGWKSEDWAAVYKAAPSFRHFQSLEPGGRLNLPPAEQQALGRLIGEGNRAARDALVLSFLGLANRFAMRAANSSAQVFTWSDREDLAQDAAQALLLGAERYDPQQSPWGSDFLPYAIVSMRGEVTNKKNERNAQRRRFYPLRSTSGDEEKDWEDRQGPRALPHLVLTPEEVLDHVKKTLEKKSGKMVPALMRFLSMPEIAISPTAYARSQGILASSFLRVYEEARKIAEEYIYEHTPMSYNPSLAYRSNIRDLPGTASILDRTPMARARAKVGQAHRRAFGSAA